MLRQNDIVNSLNSLKPKLVNDYKIKNIGLYGSYVKNMQDENSDIDILIEMGEPLGWNFFDLKLELESVFNREVDLVTTTSLHPKLKNAILKEVVFV